MRPLVSIALLSIGLLVGCTSDDYVRTEGVTPAAGNAQASNTVLQMVDPWQNGVQNTRLLVPAQRSSSTTSSAAQAAGAQSAQASASTTSN
ncbi:MULTISPECIES: hypothetical protein [unclassified Mesorhizobium]|uniref:hypothetical protein n=1 Tax=unclassified Mesorhizobium TaxID=325217 RepID=UPI000BB091A4|nr:MULTISPECIES: hypothetical protein [unclassified Mesorhizobium]TGT59561.1 hypothetical protein EN813_028620 [Mesorhizobium sp. M00.F.Ca.ET.170.01.1.1]AZO12568.1 hypothetical protein EJ074_28170 [Mesorhizobium sp. M3A.F.Ca.ET.080.04.2.1]PBB86081.1 hypothetical protein CK216_15710 [Mesorhizobium sp. WSM3876]RWB68453.1 MAG: hypothetical protein EOQ49_23190 [Mesorhizobium sp.]RWB91040.1 MAG: hypothetical protein EOQ52_06275 [Mesorhizobium sp.]